MQIRAAITRAKAAPMSLEEIELEAPRPDENLVRLVGTGICHTYIAMRDQAYPVPQPIVLGHEGSGVVERIGSAVIKVRRSHGGGVPVSLLVFGISRKDVVGGPSSITPLACKRRGCLDRPKGAPAGKGDAINPR